MSNNELLDKIKVEIERRYKEFDGKTGDIATASRLAYLDVISFLSTLESGKPIPADLEEAAEISFDEAKSLTEDYRDFLAKGLTENKPRPIGPHWFCEYAKNRFIAGAKWQKEQFQELLWMLMRPKGGWGEDKDNNEVNDK